MMIIYWTFKSNLFLTAAGIFKICSWSFNVNVWIIKFNLFLSRPKSGQRLPPTLTLLCERTNKFLLALLQANKLILVLH